jgi:hypothetical protein
VRRSLVTFTHIGANQRGGQALHAATATVAAVLAVLLAPRSAAAADASTQAVDWSKVAAFFESPLDARHLPQTQPPASSRTDGDAGVVEPPPRMGLIGRTPRVALVARDWSGSQRLLGDLVLTDELRPTQSIRMAVSRLRLAGGVVAPFVQLGLGEWRVDPTLLPTLPRVREVAAQTGLGFEVALSRSTALALEMDWTFLRVSDDADVLTTTHPTLWSTCVAARTRF